MPELHSVNISTPIFKIFSAGLQTTRLAIND